MVTRAIATACKIVSGGASEGVARDFSNAMVSAVGEAFNNVVEHAFEGREDGEVSIRINLVGQALNVEMTDNGMSFDLDAVAIPDLDALPESGMGVYIMRSFVDDLHYTAGPPNVLLMTKRVVS